MNRSFAYVCFPESGEGRTGSKRGRSYCRKLYELGFLPVCPHLEFSLYLDDEIPEEHRDRAEMAKDLLRRCRVVVVCGKELSDGMVEEIALAKRLGIVVTTLDGVEKIGAYLQDEPGDAD